MPYDDEIWSKDQEGVKRTPANCKTPYSEICLFEETRHILLLNKSKYKDSGSVGLMANKMHPVSIVFDTGLGRNLI